MTEQGAERAITVSALVVAGVYIYRRLTEGQGAPTGSKVGQLIGQGSPPSPGAFITAWGFAFLVISILAQASPGLGGSFAILVAAGDVLANGSQVTADINQKVKTTGTPGGTSVAPRTTVPIPTGPLGAGQGHR